MNQARECYTVAIPLVLGASQGTCPVPAPVGGTTQMGRLPIERVRHKCKLSGRAGQLSRSSHGARARHSCPVVHCWEVEVPSPRRVRPALGSLSDAPAAWASSLAGASTIALGMGLRIYAMYTPNLGVSMRSYLSDADR